MVEKRAYRVVAACCVMAVDDVTDGRDRLEAIEAEALVGHDQRQPPTVGEQFLAIVEEADHVDGVLDEVGRENVVVGAPLRHHVQKRPLLPDVIHGFDAVELLLRNSPRRVLGL